MTKDKENNLMGSNTGLLCQNCFYSKEFMTGMGMMYFDLNFTDIEKDFDCLLI